jgi:hypothetical protein
MLCRGTSGATLERLVDGLGAIKDDSSTAMSYAGKAALGAVKEAGVPAPILTPLWCMS